MSCQDLNEREEGMWRLSIVRPFSPGARSNAFYVEFSYPGASGVPCYLHPGMFRQSLWPISPLSIKPSQILEINKTYFKFIADKVHGYQYCRQRGITLPDSTVLPVEKVLLFQVNKNNFLGMGTQEDKVSKNPLGCKQNHLNKRKGAKS